MNTENYTTKTQEVLQQARSLAISRGQQIIDTALRYDADILGPIPLPTEMKKYTVNRSSFVFKDEL